MYRFAVAPLLLLALTACSSHDSKPVAHPAPTQVAATPSATPDPTAALRSAVQAYSDAYLTGHGRAAYALLSARCQKRMTPEEFGTIVSQAGDLYGSALPMTSFKADVAGGMARVTYTYQASAINQDAEPWVLEGGKWHEDDC